LKDDDWNTIKPLDSEPNPFEDPKIKKAKQKESKPGKHTEKLDKMLDQVI
jgi:hypothetical protein